MPVRLPAEEVREVELGLLAHVYDFAAAHLSPEALLPGRSTATGPTAPASAADRHLDDLGLPIKLLEDPPLEEVEGGVEDARVGVEPGDVARVEVEDAGEDEGRGDAEVLVGVSRWAGRTVELSASVRGCIHGREVGWPGSTPQTLTKMLRWP